MFLFTNLTNLISKLASKQARKQTIKQASKQHTYFNIVYYNPVYYNILQYNTIQSICSNIAAAGAVDRELGNIFSFFFTCWAENGLTEGREGFKKVPGGRRIHSGRVWAQTEPRGPDSWPNQNCGLRTYDVCWNIWNLLFWSNAPSRLLPKLVLEQHSATFGPKACFGATLHNFCRVVLHPPGWFYTPQGAVKHNKTLQNYGKTTLISNYSSQNPLFLSLGLLNTRPHVVPHSHTCRQGCVWD